MTDTEKLHRSKSAIDSTQHRETDLLKFVTEKASAKKVEGRRCQPKQLFGVSRESPDHFKTKTTLIADYGYCYTM